MTFCPKTYFDHMVSGGENILNAYRDNVDPNIWRIRKCPNETCNNHDFHSMRLVDCRAIDNSLIPEDWACDRCWVKWVRASKNPTNLVAELKDQSRDLPAASRAAARERNNFGIGLGHQEAEDLMEEVERSGRASPRLRDELNKAIDAGFEVKTMRRHCVTASQWMELHGAPQELVSRRKKTKEDFSP